MEPILEKAFQLARDVREKAYAEYSGFKVGAVIKAKGDDTLWSGCNVENVVNGCSSCAEKNAICKMFSEAGKQELEFVVVVTDAKRPVYPCGVCLQVISEFAQPDVRIYIADMDGIKNTHSLKDILPFIYSREDWKHEE